MPASRYSPRMWLFALATRPNIPMPKLTTAQISVPHRAKNFASCARTSFFPLFRPRTRFPGTGTGSRTSRGASGGSIFTTVAACAGSGQASPLHLRPILPPQLHSGPVHLQKTGLIWLTKTTTNCNSTCQTCRWIPVLLHQKQKTSDYLNKIQLMNLSH